MRRIRITLGCGALGAALTISGCGAGGGEGMAIGAIPMALWIVLFTAALFAIIASVQNAVVSLLYLAGRPGNDELPTRDQWIARRAELAEMGAAPASASAASAAAPAAEPAASPEAPAPAPAPAPEGSAS